MQPDRFKLPKNVTVMQLRDPIFVERVVYTRAVERELIVPDDERRHLYGLVGYCVRVEPDTPARLLTYIIRGGHRCKPWRSDLTAADWRFADNMIAQYKAWTDRKGSEGRARVAKEYAKPPDQQKAELEAKHGLKPTKTDQAIQKLLETWG
jgi:hypothetical protein